MKTQEKSFKHLSNGLLMILQVPLQQIYFDQIPFLLNSGTNPCEINIHRVFLQQILLPSCDKRSLHKAVAVPNGAIMARTAQLMAWQASSILYMPASSTVPLFHSITSSFSPDGSLQGCLPAMHTPLQGSGHT